MYTQGFRVVFSVNDNLINVKNVHERLKKKLWKLHYSALKSKIGFFNNYYGTQATFYYFAQIVGLKHDIFSKVSWYHSL